MSTGTDTVQKTTVDTFDDKAHTSTNHGGQSFISVNGDGTLTRRGYVHFARPFQLGATVFSATLKLHLLELGTEWNGSHTITARRVTEAWGEYMETWANAPATVALNSATGSVTGGSDGDLLEIDLTAMMNDVSAGEAWYGVRLEVDSTGNKSFYAAENPNQTYRAALDIDWGVIPHAPVNLNPTGNQSVSVGQPTLDWDFASPDHTATRRQTYSQVQVSTTASFASPAYDSGWVANTTSQWDLSAATSPTFTALSSGDTRYWRVRVKDDSGLASDFSDVARFQRTTKGTLTLSNPAASPSNTVNDLTPKITWSLSGRTQQAFELRLYRYNGTNIYPVWRLPRTVSTATSYNIPKHYIQTGEEYRIVVLVWDTIDRTVTPGDTDWTTIGRDFSYARSGVPAPCINLTATANGPAVHLTWHRSAIPLYFTVKRNSQEVLDRIDPGDVLTSSVVGDNTFDLNFWRATPAQAGTYEVEAVEDDGSGNLLNSDGNDTASATTKPTAIHLVDETDDTHCVINGTDDASFNIRKVSTTYDLMGSRRPVQIVDSIAGYAGTVSGVLLSAGQRDVAETLIGRTPTPLRLILADMNIEVELEDGSPTPTPIPTRDIFEVTFDWYETDADDRFVVTGG